MNSPRKPCDTIIPASLKKGDLLGIVAPAGMLFDKSLFHSGVRILHEMGFEVKFPRDLWPGKDYLADGDDNRAAELNAFFRDSDVKAIICMRGGYGCLRILDKINLNIIETHPKLLVGFSDITVLQNYLYQKTGLISLHGPTLTSLAGATRQTLAKFQQSLLGRWNDPIQEKCIVQLQGTGVVNAPLVGGNLASLTTLLGTGYDLDWSGSIVFLEDINEPIYKVDRMLTQLSAAGKFDRVKGIILGDFSPPNGAENIEKIRYKEMVWNRVLELCPDSTAPIWGEFPAGHCAHNITFPLGAEVTIDCSRSSLKFT